MPMFTAKSRRSQYLLLMLCSLFVSSCSLTDRVSYRDSEGPIPEALLDHVQKYETAKSWVTDRLGDPFSIDKPQSADEHTRFSVDEYLTYRFSRQHVRNGRLLFLLRAGTSEDSVSYYHLAIRDGLVQRAWFDEFSHVQMGMDNIEIMNEASIKQRKPKKEKAGLNWKLPFLNKKKDTDNTTSDARNVSSSESVSMIREKDERVLEAVKTGAEMESELTTHTVTEEYQPIGPIIMDASPANLTPP